MQPPPLPSSTYQATSSARVAGINANGPLAKLTVTHDKIIFRVLLLGRYEFTPEQVVSLSLGKGWISWLNYLRIEHAVADYPEDLRFYPPGGVEKALQQIRATGFQPSAPTGAAPVRHGIPVRWRAIVATILIWNALFFVDPAVRHLHGCRPDFRILLPVIFLLAACSAVRWIAALQWLVLKPGRRVGEINPWLNLLTLLMTIFLIVFSVGISVWKDH